MSHDPYDPTTALIGFQARRNLPPPASMPAAPPPAPVSPKRLRLLAPSKPVVVTPFGSTRGDQVAAKAFLPILLDERLRRFVNQSTVKPTFGEVCAKAISHAREALQPDQDVTTTTGFPQAAVTEGRLRPNEPTRPVVFYLRPAQADAIHQISQQLGGIGFSQLARAALDRYLPIEPDAVVSPADVHTVIDLDRRGLNMRG